MTPMRAPTEMVGYVDGPSPSTERRQVLRLTRNQALIVAASALITAVIAVIFVGLSPPVYNTQRAIIILSGANPNDNDVLSRALEGLVGSKGLAAEVKRRGNL